MTTPQSAQHMDLNERLEQHDKYLASRVRRNVGSAFTPFEQLFGILSTGHLTEYAASALCADCADVNSEVPPFSLLRKCVAVAVAGSDTGAPSRPGNAAAHSPSQASFRRRLSPAA